jgi:CheY-like chemotaxis protein
MNKQSAAEQNEPHIVVIEDDESLLATIVLILEASGYRVTALTAITTLAALIKLQADCFILDEQLPVLSGHIICILLRSKPETRRVPIVLISGHAELEAIAWLCRADAFLRKPFADISHLAGLLAAVMGKPRQPEVICEA